MPTTRPGTILGPYRLLEPLGGGGMGVVYHAVDEASGRRVALKTVALPDPSQLQGLRREIAALRELAHPGIVRILGQGVHEGRPWYAMELVEGAPLADWVDAAPDRITATLAVVRRLCGALAYLHGEGLVHRDLKPANILVRPDGRPVVLDFGLITRFRGDSGREGLEAALEAAGTVSWMAPEMILGHLVDARADLYAVGCILYRLLAGEPPFTGAPAVVLRRHLAAEPAPLSGVPPALADLVRRLLAKRPEDRLGYADTLGSLLEDLGAPAVEAGETRPRPYLYRPRLRGRHGPMGRVRESLEALGEGRGGITLLGGESGVGKTRLAMEVAREARMREVAVLTGECLDRDDLPFRPLQAPLQVLADRCTRDGLEQAEHLFGARGPVLAAYAPQLASLPGQDTYPEPDDLPATPALKRALQALTDTLLAWCRDEDTLLILDDLQWADELSLSWLRHLADQRAVADAPLWVLGTWRIDETSPAIQALLDHEATAVVTLERLESGAVDELIMDMLALPDPPERLGIHLLEQSEGNPFFVAEYLRIAVEEGLLWRDGHGTWQASEDAWELPLPSSLQALVGRRLERLHEPSRRLAEAAAVFGRESALPHLARVSGLEDEDLMAALRDLVRRAILEDVGGDRVRFTHDKLREGCYARLDERARLLTHRAAAEALMALDPEAEGAIGRHWALAKEPALARPYMLRTAYKTMRQGALADAEKLYRAFLDLVDEPYEESVMARNDLGSRVLQNLGRMDDARAEHERALQEARRIGSMRAEAESLRSLGVCNTRLGRLDEAQDYLERALPLLAEVGDLREEGNCWGNLATVYYFRGEYDAFERHTKRAIEAAQKSGNRLAEGVWTGNLAGAYHVLGRVDAALETYARAIAIHEEVGNRRSLALHGANLANLLMGQGHYDEAETRFEQALRVHRDIGNRTEEAMCLANLADLYYATLRLDRARTLFHEALAIAREVDSYRLVGFCLSHLADYERRYAGDPEAARRLADEAHAVLVESGDRMEYAKGLAICGHVLLASGHDAAETVAELGSVVAELNLSEGETDLSNRAARLRRAQEAFARGEHHRLFRGELWEDLPEKARRWLTATGQAPAPP